MKTILAGLTAVDNALNLKTIRGVTSFHPNEQLLNVFTGVRLVFTDDSAISLRVGTVAPGAEPSLIIEHEDNIHPQS